jgi:hypothetical protein
VLQVIYFYGAATLLTVAPPGGRPLSDKPLLRISQFLLFHIMEHDRSLDSKVTAAGHRSFLISPPFPKGRDESHTAEFLSL